MGFSKDFVWGAAAAAYQIEGAAYEDGRGLSIWDVFCRKPGAVWKGNTGNMACDHYHRHREDVAIMKKIGLMGYRMSISWPRVMPAGRGKVNAKGLAFYDKLVDELLADSIEPYVTLFHWDYPHELYCRGGWLNRESSDWFAEYTKVVVDKLGDRVKNWITLNEIQVFIGLGHLDGIHAPGLKLAVPDVLRAGHNAMLAHGKAVRMIRAMSKTKCRVGYAPVGIIKIPATQNKADIHAAHTAMFTMTDGNYWNNTWWMDPVFFGRYPEDGLKVYGDAAPKIEPGDMETISSPLDFFGVNIYLGCEMRKGKDGQPEDASRFTGYALTMKGWPVMEKSMYWGPKFLYERYKKPIIITENGMANTDWVSLDGKVHDPQRIDFVRRYLLEFRRAADDGVKAAGYFLWSVMDNFEWQEGYSKRFGIVYVDYNTQRRILKDSAYWYKKIIASNGATLDKDPGERPRR